LYFFNFNFIHIADVTGREDIAVVVALAELVLVICDCCFGLGGSCALDCFSCLSIFFSIANSLFFIYYLFGGALKGNFLFSAVFFGMAFVSGITLQKAISNRERARRHLEKQQIAQDNTPEEPAPLQATIVQAQAGSV
jgi:hypothetical protein